MATEKYTVSGEDLVKKVKQLIHEGNIRRVKVIQGGKTILEIPLSVGAPAAAIGIMVAPVVFLDPNMMSGILLYAFAGALLGGIDNPLGAVIGGFTVGVLENLFGAYVVGTELKLTVALIIIVAVLLARPAGLFGRAVQSRV